MVGSKRLQQETTTQPRKHEYTWSREIREHIDEGRARSLSLSLYTYISLVSLSALLNNAPTR